MRIPAVSTLYMPLMTRHRCCEAQERYVIAIAPNSLDVFQSLAQRERCRFTVVGTTAGAKGSSGNRLQLTDRESTEHVKPIDLPMDTLFGKPPKLSRTVERFRPSFPGFDSSLTMYLPSLSNEALIEEAITRVLKLPAVGSKSFLVTIGDRSVSGLVVRDQMVGPFQVPVSNVGITATSLTLGSRTGEVMAMGGEWHNSLVY